MGISCNTAVQFYVLCTVGPIDKVHTNVKVAENVKATANRFPKTEVLQDAVMSYKVMS